MINVEIFFKALKAAWIPRILKMNGKWTDPLHHYCKKVGLKLKDFLKLNFKNSKSFPIIDKMPEFYQEVFCSYNASKTLIPFNRLNPLHNTIPANLGQSIFYV